MASVEKKINDIIITVNGVKVGALKELKVSDKVYENVYELSDDIVEFVSKGYTGRKMKITISRKALSNTPVVKVTLK